MRIEKKTLKAAVDKLRHFTSRAKAPIDRRSVMVHFVNEGGRASMFASDLRNLAKAHFDTGEQERFEFCTTFEVVERAASAFRKDDIEVTLPDGEGCVLFKQGRSEVRGPSEDNGLMKDLEAHAFVPDDARCIEMAASEFAKRLKMAGIAINEKAKEQDIALSCISFASDGKDICLKSTDKYRISGWKSSDDLLEDGAVMEGLLPMDCRFFPSYFDSGDTVRFCLYDNKIACVSENFEAYGADINQKFQKIGFLINEPVIASFEVDVKELSEALSIAFDNSSEDDDKKKVTLDFEDGSLSISVKSKTGLSGTDSIPAVKTSGPDGEKYSFPVQQRFIKEAVAGIDGSEKVRFEVKNGKNKWYMLVYQTDDGGFGMFSQMR